MKEKFSNCGCKEKECCCSKQNSKEVLKIMPDEKTLTAAADAADKITEIEMKKLYALLSIYSEEEKAAGFEIGLLFVYHVGRMVGFSESAVIQSAK